SRQRHACGDRGEIVSAVVERRLQTGNGQVGRNTGTLQIPPRRDSTMATASQHRSPPLSAAVPKTAAVPVPATHPIRACFAALRAACANSPHDWRYSGGSRDLRLDFLRGFAVLVMVADHLGGEPSWLYSITGGNKFLFSAAEGFVFISGLVMGIVYAGMIA